MQEGYVTGARLKTFVSANAGGAHPLLMIRRLMLSTVICEYFPGSASQEKSYKISPSLQRDSSMNCQS